MEQLKEIQETAIKDDAEGMKGYIKELEQGNDGIWKFHKKRIWVPKQGDLRNKILEEAHKSRKQ
uniref:Uncharacterized protein n=1 Tax=Helianthus annuus TaxID=4232 RepID=A0A251UZD0_HELAN